MENENEKTFIPGERVYIHRFNSRGKEHEELLDEHEMKKTAQMWLDRWAEREDDWLEADGLQPKMDDDGFEERPQPGFHRRLVDIEDGDEIDYTTLEYLDILRGHQTNDPRGYFPHLITLEERKERAG